jgi:exonuclease III
VFNCHLDHTFYGPYAPGPAGVTPEAVLAEEDRSQRTRQMKGMLEVMKSYLKKADETPVFLTGDFNCPSHLDWTAATASSHGCTGAVAWPVSILVTGAGFKDSFRTLHPDPVAHPGNTWSTIHRDGEPQDRIDFAYHMGNGVRVIHSRTFDNGVKVTIGPWREEGGLDSVRVNSWPSDHSAVLTEYGLGE